MIAMAMDQTRNHSNERQTWENCATVAHVSKKQET